MSKNNSAKKRDRRDTLAIATRSVPVSTFSSFPSPVKRNQSYLSQIEDRRFWSPETPRPAASFSSSRHRLVTGGVNVNLSKKSVLSSSLFRSVPSKVAFDKPDSVLVCVRRTIRRHVLHALGKTGRTGQNKPRFTAFSKISCKRRR